MNDLCICGKCALLSTEGCVSPHHGEDTSPPRTQKTIFCVKCWERKRYNLEGVLNEIEDCQREKLGMCLKSSLCIIDSVVSPDHKCVSVFEK